MGNANSTLWPLQPRRPLISIHSSLCGQPVPACHFLASSRISVFMDITPSASNLAQALAARERHEKGDLIFPQENNFPDCAARSSPPRYFLSAHLWPAGPSLAAMYAGPIYLYGKTPARYLGVE